MTVTASFPLPPRDAFGNLAPMPNPFVAAVQTEIGAQYTVTAPSGSGTVKVIAPSGTVIGSGTSVSFTATVPQVVLVVESPASGYVTVSLVAPPPGEVPDPLILGSLITKTQPAANVLAYGADPSGATDSTDAILAAQQAAARSSGASVMGHLLIPPGTYLCGQILLLPGVIWHARGALFIPSSDLSSLPANSGWLQGNESVTFPSLTIKGGTWDATNAPSTLEFVLSLSGVNLPGLDVDGVSVLNAPVHGIYVSEQSNWTTAYKRIARCVVNGHGGSSTGYGIYANFIGNLDIVGNYVTNPSTNIDDAIECGNSGPEKLGGVDANIRAIRNVVENGQIQFPFSNYALIEGNTVIGRGIGNDTNTANQVTIANNNVFCTNTSSQITAAIEATGDNTGIFGNVVEVSEPGVVGIYGAGTSQAARQNQVRYTGSDANDATAIQVATAGASDDMYGATTQNMVLGAWGTGVSMVGNNNSARDNVIDGAAKGISIPPGSDTGFLSTGNIVEGNDLRGTTTPVSVDLSEGTNIFRNNLGYNPATVTTPSVPAASTAVTNTTGVDCTVYVTGGTDVTVSVDGTSTGVGSGSFFVPVGGTIELGAYTAAPTWSWVGN